MYKNILIPTDGSPLSRKSVLKGVKLAQALGAQVTGFYASPPASPIEFEGILPVDYVPPAKHARLIANAAAEHLEFIEKAALAAGVTCTTVHVTSDFAADAIVAAAKQHKCDVIFMASHGRRGLSSLLLGSQTQKVLAKAKVPVVVDR
jgi:nucleotide-binding universal stress UspA family protein